MSKKTISIEATTVRFQNAVSIRVKAEDEVRRLTHEKIEAEAKLRDARENERKALRDYEQAVEDSVR